MWQLSQTKYILKGNQRIDFYYYIQNRGRYIVRRVITPFDIFTSSEHRYIYLDINLLIFLNITFINYPTLDTRLLTSTNPHAVLKCKTELIKRLTKHDMIPQVNTIQK